MSPHLSEARLDDGPGLAQDLQPYLHPIDGMAVDDALVSLVARSRIVLLGEASHGTHEFYAFRAALTRRLVEDHGFQAVVIEGDWPDAWRVNRFVRGWDGAHADADAAEALTGFQRFPTWMWRNTAVREFIDWLHAFNRARPGSRRVGFYGMDLYSLFGSIEAVLAYLDRTDAAAARDARARYACFDHFREDGQAYGHAASFGLQPHCEDEVLQQLREMSRRSAALASTPGTEREDAFFALQNARLVRNAEAYYRSMFHRSVSSWNLRDEHMTQTLQALDTHLSRPGAPARLVVWAHNSHLGDASATEMGDQGELNVGQLARTHWGTDAVRVGFSTYHGTVAAASAWDAPVERKRVQDGLPDSFEALFHATGVPAFWLALQGDAGLAKLLRQRRLQRAIGVIYMPRTERASHYFHVQLPQQFDFMIHFDRTRAVVPLDEAEGWPAGGEPAETFPSGF